MTILLRRTVGRPVIARDTANTYRPHLENNGFQFEYELPGYALPVRGDAPGFGATLKATGLSPALGIVPDTVIHGMLDTALQRQRSWVAPPQVVGSLCWMTSNDPGPPSAANVTSVRLTA